MSGCVTESNMKLDVDQINNIIFYAKYYINEKPDIINIVINMFKNTIYKQIYINSCQKEDLLIL